MLQAPEREATLEEEWWRGREQRRHLGTGLGIVEGVEGVGEEDGRRACRWGRSCEELRLRRRKRGRKLRTQGAMGGGCGEERG